MKILSALASITDVKDFRLREFMSRLGLDPSQPVLFYRPLIIEAREVVKFIAEVSQLRSEAKTLRSEVASVKREKDAAVRTANEQAGAWREKFNQSEQRTTDVQGQITSLQVQLAQSREPVQFANAIVASLRAFLADDYKLEVLNNVFRWVADVHDEAMRRATYGLPPSPVDDLRTSSVGLFLRNQLRKALALSPEEYIFARFYLAVWDDGCVLCAQRCLPDQEIISMHVSCPPDS